MFYSWPKKTRAAPGVAVEEHLSASMWDTYHRNGDLLNGSSWKHTALPNVSASDETSKPCSDVLGEGDPEGSAKEEIEGTRPKTQTGDKPTEE